MSVHAHENAKFVFRDEILYTITKINKESYEPSHRIRVNFFSKTHTERD